MTKKKNKTVILFIICFSLICLFGFKIIPNKTNKDTYKATAPNNLANEEEIGQKAKITSASIIQKKTGIGPFDENDEPGNDSSEDNNIVRSFDQVTWTIENIMNLKSGVTSENLKGGILDVKAEVPSTLANMVEWDVDSMKWAENATISNDGTILTAQYIMSDTEVTVPGTQTLEFVMKVLGAPNEAEIIPTFWINIYGNDASEGQKITGEKIQVSAVPNYNVVLKRNTYLANKTTVDYGEGDTSGRMYGYGVMLELYNQDESKGLKGIEYPQGEIKFDIDLKLERSKFDSVELEDITEKSTPVLWNYCINDNNPTGLIEGREIWSSGNTYDYYQNTMPLGVKRNDRTYTVNNSGNLKMEQIGEKIQVSVSDYEIDGIFPIYEYGYETKTRTIRDYEENEGIFQVGYMQLFIPDNDESTMEDRSYYLTVKDTNFNAVSISGKTTTNQMNVNDDEDVVNHVVYQKGSYIHNIGFSDPSVESRYGAGDGSTVIGSVIKVRTKFAMDTSNDYDIESATKFIKFDGDAFEPVLYDNNNNKYYIDRQYFAGTMDFKVWYVTKPDGTNWIDQTEMNNGNIEDMNIYENIEDIPNGYICIGEFLESTGGNLSVITGRNNTVNIKVKVKETAKIGQTYGFTQRTKYWKDELDRNIYTVTNKDVTYPKTTWDSGNREYVKTEYDENGKMIPGTHLGGYTYGNSLLILGAKQSISIETVDNKKNYNIGNSENVVQYKVIPNLTEATTSTPITNITLKIKNVLPKGVDYIAGSCEYGEPEEKITNDDDGTTTLVWYKYGCSTMEAIDPIEYEAHIDEESENGTQYEVTATIEEVIEEGQNYKIGNEIIDRRTATTSINIINLSSYALYKNVTTPIIELNGDIHFKITAINKTDSPATDFQLLDVLPYTGDSNGSNFSGNYTLSKINLSTTDTKTSNKVDNDLKIYITDDESVRTSVDVKDTNLGTTSIWENIQSAQNISKESKGIAVIGTLEKRTKLEVDIYLKTNGNKQKDVYKNMVKAQTSKTAEAIVSSIVKAQTIKREISGKAWFDANKNGVIDDDEEYMSGVKVTLINEDGTIAKDIAGNNIQFVTTDNNGYYHFEDMVKGDYKLKVEYNNDNNQKEITYKDIGTNKEINSKFNSDGTTDLITYLNSIESPELKVEHQNVGITYKDSSVVVHYYVENSTTPVTLKDGTKAEDKTINGKINDDYETKPANVAEYYELVAIPENSKGTMGTNQTEVTYYYRLKNYPYTVKYIDKDTNEEIGTAKTVIDKAYGTVIKAEDEKKTFEKYTYDSADKQNLIIGTDKNEIILYYTKKRGTVTTKYIDQNTQKEISDRETTTGKVDETYSANKKSIEGYTYIQDTKNTTGKYTEDPIEVIYYYKQNAKVKVNHIDKVTGEILDSVSADGLVGDSYTSASKNFENYVLTEKPENETVTLTKDEIVLNYYYTQVSGGIIEKHIDNYTGNILYNESHTGNEGDPYEIKSKEFEGYDLVESKLPENSKGTMRIDPITVEYYYAYKTNVTSKYIDAITGEKLTEDIIQNGHEGDNYTTEKKDFDNYVLIEEPENSTGTMTKDGVKVTYKYVHVAGGVTTKYIDINSKEELKDATTQKGNEGEDYETTEEKIEGYDIVEEKYPENAKGKMTIDPIEVDYYYIKKSNVNVKYIDSITGKEIIENKTIQGHVGDSYATNQEEIDGYDLTGVPENKNGTMTKETTEVIYYYTRKAKVVVNYLEDGTNEPLKEQVILNGHENDPYETKELDIENYVLIKEKYPTNPKGNFTVNEKENKGQIEVNYYYRKKIFNLKAEKTISSIIINGTETEVKNNKLGKIEISRKQINSTSVQVIYTIKVINDGELAGSGTLVENIPDGMTIDTSKNPGWTVEGNTAKLDTKNIEIGQTKEYKIILDWQNVAENFGTKTNVAQLTSTKNTANFAESNIDDNKDTADLLISVSTGIKNFTISMSILLASFIVITLIILKVKYGVRIIIEVKD